jgi:hypothetical protein
MYVVELDVPRPSPSPFLGDEGVSSVSLPGVEVSIFLRFAVDFEDAAGLLVTTVVELPPCSQGSCRGMLNFLELDADIREPDG